MKTISHLETSRNLNKSKQFVVMDVPSRFQKLFSGDSMSQALTLRSSSCWACISWRGKVMNLGRQHMMWKVVVEWDRKNHRTLWVWLFHSRSTSRTQQIEQMCTVAKPNTVVQFHIHSPLGNQSLLGCLSYPEYSGLNCEYPRFRRVNAVCPDIKGNCSYLPVPAL